MGLHSPLLTIGKLLNLPSTAPDDLFQLRLLEIFSEAAPDMSADNIIVPSVVKMQTMSSDPFPFNYNPDQHLKRVPNVFPTLAGRDLPRSPGIQVTSSCDSM